MESKLKGLKPITDCGPTREQQSALSTMVKSLSPSSSVKMIPKLTAPVFTKKNNSVSFINLLEKTKPKKARKPKPLIED